MNLPPSIPISSVVAAPPGVLLETVLAVLPAAVSVLRGPEHHIEYVNPLAQRLAGDRSVLGRATREAYPELQGQGLLERLDHVYATGEPYHASDSRILFDRDGDGEPEEGFFSLTYQPLLAADGSVSGIVTLAVEVTDLVRMREQLEAARVEAEAQAEQISGMATQLEEQAAELEQQLAEAQAGAEELEEANQELAAANLAAAAAREEEAELVEILHRIGASLTAEFDLERIVQSATDAATRLVDAQFGAFFYNVLDESGESYTLYTLSGVPREAFAGFPMPRNTAVFSPTFHGEGVVRSDDITRDPRYGKNAPYHGMPRGHLPVKSYLAVPVVSRGGEVLGGLFFGHSDPGVFTERSERIAVGIAGWAAVAIDNARLHEGERRAGAAAARAADLARRLLVITELLNRAVTPEEVARVVVDEATDAVGADAGSLALLSSDGDRFRTAAMRGYPDSLSARFAEYPLQGGRPMSDAVLAGQPVTLRSYADWQARYPEMAEAFRESGYEAFAAIPVLIEGKAAGALGFSYHDVRGFDETDATFLRTVAGHCATALERARLYEAERGLRAEAEAANLAKSQFLASMSHELRTPLNAIGGYADLMEMGVRGPVTEEQRGDLERIKRAQQHLLGLINDVLNFAKLEAGRVEFDIRRVAVDDVLINVEALTAPQLQAKGLAYARTEPCALTFARADPEKLEQILLNLLANAIKFTGPGGSVAVECVDEGERVRIAVTDTGPGIAPERQSDIFEPFVQVDADLARARQGTGLGLAISRELARAMGGELAVESRVGEGSTFILTIPGA
ncbi:MAG TPA: GAF domain-containing protein [Longimicrobium sp.]